MAAGMVLNFTYQNWSTVCQSQREFCTRAIAVHEFGHALGFAHEQNRPDTPSWCDQEQGSDGDVTIGAWDLDSVMNYCNPNWNGNGNLSSTDIIGVRSLYGSPQRAALDGRGAYLGKAFFFRGGEYVRYDWATNDVDPGYPASLGLWNLPGAFLDGIDAALNGSGSYDGKAYFFRGNGYVRYDWASGNVDPGYPASLSAWNLPGDFANGIDDAINGQGDFAGKAYFFRGGEYVRYDWASGNVDPYYPQPISLWGGLERLW